MGRESCYGGGQDAVIVWGRADGWYWTSMRLASSKLRSSVLSCVVAWWGADCGYGKKSYLGGMGAYTRQRTTRGAANKRRKVADGSPKTGPDLHLSSSDLMELEYECVGGEPPAAAAKIRSGMYALFELEGVWW